MFASSQVDRIASLHLWPFFCSSKQQANMRFWMKLAHAEDKCAKSLRRLPSTSKRQRVLSFDSLDFIKNPMKSHQKIEVKSGQPWDNESTSLETWDRCGMTSCRWRSGLLKPPAGKAWPRDHRDQRFMQQIPLECFLGGKEPPESTDAGSVVEVPLPVTWLQPVGI